MILMVGRQATRGELIDAADRGKLSVKDEVYVRRFLRGVSPLRQATAFLRPYMRKPQENPRTFNIHRRL